MFLCDCLCTFSVLLCVFLWCYLDYISANSFCSAFLNGSSPLKNRFLCCNSSIFAPKVLLQRVEVSLVAWSLHWLFAIFTNVNCLCGNFENDYVKSLKVFVWASWFETVNWIIYFSSTPFVDMSMLVGVFSHLTVLTSEVVVVVRLLLTVRSWSLPLCVPYFLASSLVLSALSACQSSVDFKNCFSESKLLWGCWILTSGCCQTVVVTSTSVKVGECRRMWPWFSCCRQKLTIQQL